MFENELINSEYCSCENSNSVSTEQNDFGYWYVCSNCGKRIDDDFHYFNHYDGEDHDDIDLY